MCVAEIKFYFCAKNLDMHAGPSANLEKTANLARSSDLNLDYIIVQPLSTTVHRFRSQICVERELGSCTTINFWSRSKEFRFDRT